MSDICTWTYNISGPDTEDITITPGQDLNGIYTAQSAAGTFDGYSVTNIGSSYGNPDNMLSVAGSQYFAGFDSSSISFDLDNGHAVRLFSNGSTFEYSLSSANVTSPGFTTTARYLRGTLIATPSGEKSIESLVIGDLVVTSSGNSEPVHWTARRSCKLCSARATADVRPVCSIANALADGVPCRDLLLSPRHAIFLDGVLVQANDSDNDVTIFEATATELIDYFHVELAQHDIVIANNAPSESYIDNYSRLFQNRDEYFALYPNSKGCSPLYCAPRVSSGQTLEAIRREISVGTKILFDQVA